MPPSRRWTRSAAVARSSTSCSPSTAPSPAAARRRTSSAACTVELIDGDLRDVRNNGVHPAWRERIDPPAGLENLTIASRRVGPPGRDLTIRLTGPDAEVLKAAAVDLSETISGIDGVREVEDDMAYGREQLIYSLTPAGEALGLTVADLGRQLRTPSTASWCRSSRTARTRSRSGCGCRRRSATLASLYRLNVRTPSGESVPLTSVADWRSRRGFEVLRHADGRLAVEVTADVDTSVNNSNRIIAALEQGPLTALRTRLRHPLLLRGALGGSARHPVDMRKGLILGLILIYVILAWVFSSYGWPLVVMAVIPFGLTGALIGHWVMGIDLTILSLFGMFGLSGIVVNDSIILVTFYKTPARLRHGRAEALVEAACQRLRAVLLTSHDHHRRPHAAAVREVLPGAVPDPDGHLHRLRPRLRDRAGAAGDPVAVVDARECPRGKPELVAGT
jgi:multidrug efflux pump subunit AcrB